MRTIIYENEKQFDKKITDDIINDVVMARRLCNIKSRAVINISKYIIEIPYVYSIQELYNKTTLPNSLVNIIEQYIKDELIMDYNINFEKIKGNRKITIEMTFNGEINYKKYEFTCLNHIVRC